MKQILLFSLLTLAASMSFSQTQFRISPYINGLSNIKDGIIELGGELRSSGDNLKLTAFCRFPNKGSDNSLIALDRYANDVRGVFMLNYLLDKTGTVGNMKYHNLSLQLELGNKNYQYYPLGNKESEKKENHNSYAGEMTFSTLMGNPKGTQKSWTLRLRYSREHKAEDAIGIVLPPANGITATTDLVIVPPSKRSLLSPAVVFQWYKTGLFSYALAAYYDMTGRKGQESPFNDLHRLRLEGWLFFYPADTGNINTKLGIGPYLSIRTRGTDNFNGLEFGIQFTVKLKSMFQDFKL